jgi:hypothetical protein
MSSMPPPAQSHRIVVVAVVTAAVAVTLFALVGIAYMIGWLPARSGVATPVSMASPALQAAGTAPGIALLPGESIVTPEATAPAVTEPAPAAAPPAPGPTTPIYKRSAPAPIPARKPPASARANPEESICVNCGTVTSTVAYPDSWEVRVRFEDGASQTFRYDAPPNLRLGQRVRLENNGLVRER